MYGNFFLRRIWKGVSEPCIYENRGVKPLFFDYLENCLRYRNMSLGKVVDSFPLNHLVSIISLSSARFIKFMQFWRRKNSFLPRFSLKKTYEVLLTRTVQRRHCLKKEDEIWKRGTEGGQKETTKWGHIFRAHKWGTKQGKTSRLRTTSREIEIIGDVMP